MGNIEKTKIQLRNEILTLRSKLDTETVAQVALDSRDRLLALPAFSNAKYVMLYMDYRKEVPTRLLVDAVRESGKILVLPYTDKNFEIFPYAIPSIRENLSTLTSEDDLFCYLSKSKMGIWEPNIHMKQLPKPILVEPSKINLVIIPGVAFDLDGNRLGYGKGCYDRFLPKLSPDAPKLGLAYDLQMVDRLPHHPLDVKIDAFL